MQTLTPLTSLLQKSICLVTSLLLLSVIGACTAQNKENNADVVVIFKDCPNHNSTKKVGPGNMSVNPKATLIYTDKEGYLQSYNPKQEGYDTVVVPSHKGYAEIEHRNQVIESIYYLVEAGDTVLFTYNAETTRPHIESLVKEHNTWLYNLPEEDSRAVDQKTGYSNKTMTSYQFLKMWKYINDPKYRNNPKPSVQKMVKNLKAICPNIDSLQPIYAQYVLDYQAKTDSLAKAGKIDSAYAAYLKELPVRDTMQKSCKLIYSDESMHSPFAHHMAKKQISSFDTLKVLKALQNDSISKLAKISVMHTLANVDLWDDDSFEKFAKREYKKLIGEEKFNQIFKPRDTKLENYTADLLLKDKEGKLFELKNILAQHKGKVIYLDLWASWCSPCRSGMPSAKELRKEYSNKDVVFLYFAINDNEDEWKQAIIECETEAYNGINYFAINSAKAEFMREIENTYIPHFVLFNKEGKVVNKNAPRAGTEEIRREIDKLLQ